MTENRPPVNTDRSPVWVDRVSLRTRSTHPPARERAKVCATLSVAMSRRLSSQRSSTRGKARATNGAGGESLRHTLGGGE